MPRLRTAERAHICRICRLQALRTLHTSSPRRAERSFFARIRDSVFGTKESREAEKRREEAQRRRIEELAAQSSATEVEADAVVDRHGREYEVAAVVDASVNTGYVPATSWDGLERIGGEEWVRKRADGGEVYYGFASNVKRPLTDEQWKNLLHHVAVEVLLLQQAGRRLDDVCIQRGPRRNNQHRTRKVGIVVEKGGVTLESEYPTAKLLAGIPDVAQEPSAASVEVLQHEKQAAASGELAQSDDAWLQMPLTDARIKFAILKRTAQLSGHRLRDPVISSVHTLQDLYDACKAKEKPRKLAQTPPLKQLRAAAPNVTVHGRRQTPIDRHREVGRWKVIEDELRQRDLPVTGSRWPGAKTQVGTLGDKKSKKGKKFAT